MKNQNKKLKEYENKCYKGNVLDEYLCQCPCHKPKECKSPEQEFIDRNYNMVKDKENLSIMPPLNPQFIKVPKKYKHKITMITNLQEKWEEEPEVEKWIEQGRDPEHIYAVKNFLTGQGSVMINRLLSEQHLKDKEEFKKLIEETDPSTNRKTSPAYWGNVLKTKLQNL